MSENTALFRAQMFSLLLERTSKGSISVEVESLDDGSAVSWAGQFVGVLFDWKTDPKEDHLLFETKIAVRDADSENKDHAIQLLDEYDFLCRTVEEACREQRQYYYH